MWFTDTIWSFLYLVWLFPTLSCSICYYPNGDVAPQDTPCHGGTASSTCCGQGYACLSNNICMATRYDIQKPGATLYVRGSCTDKTWRSSNCPLFCINPAPPYMDNVAGGEGIVKCPNTTKDMYYCLDYNYKAANCTTEQNVLIFQGTPSVITTIGVTKTSSTASSTSFLTSKSVSSSTFGTQTTSSSATKSKSLVTAATSPNTAIAAATAATTKNPVTVASQPSSKKGRTISLAATIPSAAVMAAFGVAVFLFIRRRNSKRLPPGSAEAEHSPGTFAGPSMPSQLNATKAEFKPTVPLHAYPRPGGGLYEVPANEGQVFELPGWRASKI